MTAESMNTVLLLDIVALWRNIVEPVSPFTVRTPQHCCRTFDLIG
jgi:hypothetical protein